MPKKRKWKNFASNIKRSMTTKEKLKNIVRKEKVVNSSTNAMGFISRAVREIYPSIRNKPAENNEFKKAIQVARRCYQSRV